MYLTRDSCFGTLVYYDITFVGSLHRQAWAVPFHTRKRARIS